jgi:hypothetical protein
MKKFISLRTLAITLIAAIGITSCSKNDETNAGLNGNAKVSSYLKSFYSKDFQLGKSVDTKFTKPTSELSKSTEVENLVVTEVFVGEDDRARGYVISDKSTNEFLYFIDVDRIDYKLTSVKIDLNDTMLFNNIDELDKYVSTNEFDLIKVAEQINTGILQNYKFWGWGDWQYSACIGGVKNAIRIYHVFWLSAGYQEQLGIPCERELNPQ